MINQLLICEADLPKLVGTLLLSRDDDEHNLVNTGNKRFVMEKRLLMVVSSKGKYGLAHFHAGYNIYLKTPEEFVKKINTRDTEYRFYSLVTPAELKIIHQWQLEDLEKL